VAVGTGAEVWNLSVAETPEYFANGILVHNCMQAFFTLAGSFHDVYGTEMCPDEKCGRGFARNLNGRPRTRCPYCNAPLETEEDEAA
jgi:hypothetical protein